MELLEKKEPVFEVEKTKKFSEMSPATEERLRMEYESAIQASLKVAGQLKKEWGNEVPNITEEFLRARTSFEQFVKRGKILDGMIEKHNVSAETSRLAARGFKYGSGTNSWLDSKTGNMLWKNGSGKEVAVGSNKRDPKKADFGNPDLWKWAEEK